MPGRPRSPESCRTASRKQAAIRPGTAIHHQIVTPSKSTSIVSIDLRGPIRRVVLLLPAILALAGAWFVVHWYLGDTIAEYAPDTEEGGQDLARLAVKWAPGDPFTHFVLGGVDQKEFSDGQLADAVREYETAVRLSPNDYRYWMQLGRALEASGDIVRGEQTMRHAIELAPAYSFPRWYLGNMLLREGKQDEGLRELVRASQADPQLLPQVFNLTWEIFAGTLMRLPTRCVRPPMRAGSWRFISSIETKPTMRCESGPASAREIEKRCASLARS